MESIREFSHKIKNYYKFPYKINVRFGGVVTEVFLTDTEITDKLKDYYETFLVEDEVSADMTVYTIESKLESMPDSSLTSLEYIVKKPDPGKTKIKEEFADFADGRVVKKRLTGMYFAFGDDINIACGPCAENDNQVVNFINNRFIEKMLKSGYLLFHSAAVCANGKGVAMSGFSGMGKSTLALHMMNLGVNFVSNDRLLVKENGDRLEMYGVAKHPRINPGTIINNENLKVLIEPERIEELKNMPAAELWDLEEKYDGFIDEIYGDEKFVINSAMDILIILNWKREDKPAVIEEIDIENRRELLPAFTKSPGLFFYGEKKPDLSDEKYINLLKKCRIFEVSGGVDFESTAKYFANLLES